MASGGTTSFLAAAVDQMHDAVVPETGDKHCKLEIKLKISEEAVDREVFGAGVDYAVTRLTYQIDILNKLAYLCGGV